MRIDESELNAIWMLDFIIFTGYVIDLVNYNNVLDKN